MLQTVQTCCALFTREQTTRQQQRHADPQQLFPLRHPSMTYNCALFFLSCQTAWHFLFSPNNWWKILVRNVFLDFFLLQLHCHQSSKIPISLSVCILSVALETACVFAGWGQKETMEADTSATSKSKLTDESEGDDPSQENSLYGQDGDEMPIEAQEQLSKVLQVQICALNRDCATYNAFNRKKQMRSSCRSGWNLITSRLLWKWVFKTLCSLNPQWLMIWAEQVQKEQEPSQKCPSESTATCEQHLRNPKGLSFLKNSSAEYCL